MRDIEILRKLVDEGENLEKEFSNNDFLFKTTKSITELTEWMYEVVFWLEKKRPDSEVTRQIKKDSKHVSNENLHYSVYQTTLGSLKALIKSEDH